MNYWWDSLQVSNLLIIQPMNRKTLLLELFNHIPPNCSELVALSMLIEYWSEPNESNLVLFSEIIKKTAQDPINKGLEQLLSHMSDIVLLIIDVPFKNKSDDLPKVQEIITSIQSLK